jgi:Uma2 family endonuclease
MNAPTRAEREPQRRLFTVDEVLAMQSAGVFRDFEKVELLEGELITMQAKLDRHEKFKTALLRRLILSLPEDVDVLAEATLYASETSAPDPDIMVLTKGWKLRELTPRDVRLIVEVADSSLSKDLGLKAKIYAAFGAPEYWVIDVQVPRLIVHRGADGDMWREVRVIEAAEAVAPAAFPGAAVRLADLER